MTPKNEIDRLTTWLQNNKPPTDYTREDIRYWLRNNNPGFNNMSRSNQREVLQDWENFTVIDNQGDYIGPSEPAVKSWIGRLGDKIKNTLRRLLRR